eukprot:comp22178_c0_seq1/m.52178 comp22178_c0_seq1/g.52178  ORF comp22178_c0_seq1/g.52178 comp22178_c0_seq1/m.52178 type:complete len:474 (+) comp22178_c0_seq1:162-1583(+)
MGNMCKKEVPVERAVDSALSQNRKKKHNEKGRQELNMAAEAVVHSLNKPIEGDSIEAALERLGYNIGKQHKDNKSSKKDSDKNGGGDGDDGDNMNGGWMDRVLEDMSFSSDENSTGAKGKSKRKKTRKAPGYFRHQISNRHVWDIIDEEREGPPGDPWELTVDKEGAQLYRLIDEEKDIACYRLFGRIQADVETAYKVLMDNFYRKEWDEYVGSLETLPMDIKWVRDTEAYRLVALFPSGLSNREYVIYRRSVKLENGDYVIVSKTGDHPEAPDAKRKSEDLVRGVLHYSGMLLRAAEDDPDGATTFFYTWSDDPGGSIPQFVVKWFTSKAIPNYIEQLSTVSQSYRTRASKYEVPEPGLLPEDSRPKGAPHGAGAKLRVRKLRKVRRKEKDAESRSSHHRAQSERYDASARGYSEGTQSEGGKARANRHKSAHKGKGPRRRHGHDEDDNDENSDAKSGSEGEDATASLSSSS